MKSKESGQESSLAEPLAYKILAQASLSVGPLCSLEVGVIRGGAGLASPGPLPASRG